MAPQAPRRHVRRGPSAARTLEGLIRGVPSRACTCARSRAVAAIARRPHLRDRPGAAATARAAGAYPTLGDHVRRRLSPTGDGRERGHRRPRQRAPTSDARKRDRPGRPGSPPVGGDPRTDLTESPLADTTLASLHLETLPIDLPLSTIPISRSSAPHTWQELLAGTTLEDVPLVAVTWKNVKALAAPPAGLRVISMADVDWTNSVLADLPLAAFTFGGADITTVMIPLQPGEPARTRPPPSAGATCSTSSRPAPARARRRSPARP